ncbi:unnamed protein product, partial [Pylaiella littoralis]
MLQHRSPAPAGGRRQAGGGARQPKAFGVAVDRAPIILTRAELQRRTRERSRLAALKIAEEHGKEREQREAAAKRKSAAKALAAQARHDNAIRFRRDSPSAGPPERSGLWGQGRHADAAATGGGGRRTRSRSPHAVTAVERGRSQTAPASDGSNTRTDGAGNVDQCVAAARMTRSRPRPAWQQQMQQRQNLAREMYQPEVNRKDSAGLSR